MIPELFVVMCDYYDQLVRGDARKKLNETWDGQRDKLYEEKLKEIEEAHKKWLNEKASHYQTQEEERAATGEDVTYSMRMGQQDDDVN